VLLRTGTFPPCVSPICAWALHASRTPAAGGFSAASAGGAAAAGVAAGGDVATEGGAEPGAV